MLMCSIRVGLEHLLLMVRSASATDGHLHGVSRSNDTHPFAQSLLTFAKQRSKRFRKIHTELVASQVVLAEMFRDMGDAMAIRHDCVRGAF